MARSVPGATAVKRTVQQEVILMSMLTPTMPRALKDAT